MNGKYRKHIGCIMNTEAFTNKQHQELSALLAKIGSEAAMTLEMLDGFLTALISGPETVSPNEYLPEIWGGQTLDDTLLTDEAELQGFLDLIKNHWNDIVHRLSYDDIFLPILHEDDQGISENDWAFIRGMHMRYENWQGLLDDENNGGALIPIFALANEHNPDPELRPYKDPIDQELRDKLIAGLAACAIRISNYFARQRRILQRSDKNIKTYRRTVPKLGRNDPCYCGSGKKFKHCCANIVLN